MRLRRCAVVAFLAAAACGGGSSSDDNATSTDAVTSSCGDATDAAPDDLACTGLYADFASKALSPRARPYAPARSFWSDGADKQRWIDLPDGATIDASSMDDWKLPVGTKAWKELSVGGKKVETRFFWKVRDDKWVQSAYLWSDDGSSAKRVDGADLTVAGQPYHVPKESECDECHRGRKDRLLGFEAISLGLSGANGVTLAQLASEGKLAPAPAKTSFAIQDDGTTKAAAALGWLHVNCGVTCHNGTATAVAYSTKLRLRLRVADLDGAPDEKWDAIATTIGVAATTPTFAGDTRIVAGDPDNSLLVHVTTIRGDSEQMPPIASRLVDQDGTAALAAWIGAMKKAEPPKKPSVLVTR
jgi:hypothetical protein